MEDEKPNSYKVTLNTGDHAVFTNENNLDDYLQRLTSGTYGIVSTRNNQNIPITTENVSSIVQVCSHCQADIATDPGQRFCAACQGFTWISAPEYNTPR